MFTGQPFTNITLIHPICSGKSSRISWTVSLPLPASPPRIIDQRNQKALLAATSEFFDFIKENKRTFHILFNDSSGNSFSARLVEFLCNGYVPVGNSADELTSGFIRTYIANGTVGMMREWVNTDFRISSQDLAEMMYFLSREISQY